MLVNFAFWAAAAAAAAAAVNAGNPETRKFVIIDFLIPPSIQLHIVLFFAPHEIRTLMTAIIDSITVPNYRRYNMKLIIGSIAGLNYWLIFGWITVLDYWRYKMVGYRIVL